MIVVIFESWPKPGKGRDYIDFGVKLAHLLEGRDGFISVERFESVVEPGKFVALSFWRDEAAVNAFRQVPAHRSIQSKSRQEVFDDYRLRVANVIRDYSKDDRSQAP
ncbi:heme-degrading monooxygenase HmoA [Bradyrhizobium sp. USDA 3686]|uniref:antibiotic biosynthesis monooxygenase family protein n=1 Tax=Bradyrhizobium canariense TaxID=255045 RepID=UPI00195B3B69|nr:antibiotic biosynthesis monooxygenase [Bradyrhizobium canariense]MBM7486801.1 heme-degrading monooxygenase HmoA [Bradyrhizobium canariense]